MKKILLGLVAASCLVSFAIPAFAADDKPAAEGDKAEKKAKKAKKEKKEKKDKKEGEAAPTK